MHPDVTELNEFKFFFGDPRLCLLKYLKKTVPSKFETYINNCDNVKPDDMILFKCIPETAESKSKKDLIMPKSKKMNVIIQNVLKNEKTPILIFPILIMGKLSCSSVKSNAKHINYILFNRITNEIERIDIKKFHIKKFTSKLIYKRLKEPTFITESEDIELVSDLDVPTNFMARYPESTVKQLFPTYLINYITLRCKHPKMTSKEIHHKMANVSEELINKNWEIYKKISLSMNVIKCPEDTILKFENLKCISTHSSEHKRMLIEKPVKECPIDKVFNMLTNRCVDPKKLKDINILLDKILEAKIDPKFKFLPLGRGSTIISSITFVLSKHPSGYLVFPRKAKQSIDKNHFMIRWVWNEDEQKCNMTIPDGMEESWKKGLNNPEVRFLIILISMVSSKNGKHANCLIYDKKHNEIERFDSLGGYISDTYYADDMDIQLNEWLAKFAPANIKYFKPITYCVRDIYQRREIDEINYDDTSGNCAVWRLWYIDLRLTNPILNRKQVVKLSMSKLEIIGSFQKFIKSYQAYIISHIKK